MFSIPIIIIIFVQGLLKTANANWAVTAYPAACILISGLLNQKNNLLKILIWLGISMNFLIFLFILKISITGKLEPIKLESDPLRKLKGFESQSNSIKEILDLNKFQGLSLIKEVTLLDLTIT